jgi:hypothetical protein
MTYKEFLEYPLKIMESVYAQKVIIYSMGALFILITLTQNLNLFSPSLFKPIITGCEDLNIEYPLTHTVYEILKVITYDILVISSFAWFLKKYKFCEFTLTAFYGFIASTIIWSILSISGVSGFPLDLTTTLIVDFAWIVYLYRRIKSNRK